VQAYFLLARSFHESKGIAAAVPWYERAAKEEPANAMPHYYLAYAYKERGQKSRAVQEFKKFLEKKPDAPEKKDIEKEIEDLAGD
jgi:tetratricopeptide (TPR) repeat protein